MRMTGKAELGNGLESPFHPREHVLVEDKTARRLAGADGARQGIFVAELAPSKPSSSSEKRKRIGQDPIADGDQNGRGFRQIALLQAHAAKLSLRIAANSRRGRGHVALS